MAHGPIRVLSKGARITVGVLCVLFAAHTLIWLVRDVAELDPGTVWSLWTGSGDPEATSKLPVVPATGAGDLGLLVLQLAAVFAAFTRAWSAGGLLGVTTAVTLAYRAAAVWQGPQNDFTDTASGRWALLSSALVVLVGVAAALVLVAGSAPWPRRRLAGAGMPGVPGAPGGAFAGAVPPLPHEQPGPPPFAAEQEEPPLPSESPQHPTPGGAVWAALFLGVLAAFDIGWNLYTLVQSGPEVWASTLIGHHAVFTLLGVASGYNWLVSAALCTVGAALAGTRRVSARGFSLGIALLLLPGSLTGLYGALHAGSLFDIGGPSPGLSFFSSLQMVVILLGGGAVVAVSMRAGVPATPSAMPPGGPAFAGPPPPYPYGAPPQPGQPPYGVPPSPPPVPPQPPRPPHGGGPGGGFGPPPGA